MRMRSCITVMVGVLALATHASTAAANACRASSPGHVVPLVELYTSEGCDSCPPADRWLSSNFGATSTEAIALAFHVDYWDRLGWKDRFASPRYTERQRRAMLANAATFVYTPQVLLQGRDHREWRSVRLPEALAAIRKGRAGVFIAAQAVVDGDEVSVSASISRSDAAPRDAAVAFAYLDSGLVSEVAAGENRGARLVHDHVVRDLTTRPLDAATQSFKVKLHRPAERGASARVVIFVQDARRGEVLQAMALSLSDCR